MANIDPGELAPVKLDTWMDVSNEAFRTYVFPNGAEVRIDAPVKLNVKRKPEGDSHRLVDANNRSHYIPSGWVHLYWEGKDKQSSQYNF